MISLSPIDWLQLLLHFGLLSLLGVGGAITTLPEMHRYLVDRQQWLLDEQFNVSVALAQASPGPNILFVALMGWHVGLNAGGGWLAPLGALLTLAGIMVPSSLLMYATGQWLHRHRQMRLIRAFKQGLAPTVIGLLIATGTIMASAGAATPGQWPVWLIAAVATLLVWRTRLHILWLLGAGAVVGALFLA